MFYVLEYHECVTIQECDEAVDDSDEDNNNSTLGL